MRLRRPFLAVPLVLLGLVTAAPAHAADPGTVVGHLLLPSQVREYAGIQVLSAFDGTAYRLAIRRSGAIEPLPVAPSRAPFDVDIGPDRSGRPRLVYTRCTVETENGGLGNRNTGCDLVSLSLAGGGERSVRGANTEANEFAPTVWRGRIAFARAAKGREHPVVYTTALDATHAAVKRLPAIPRRERGFPTHYGGIAELELHGNRLAQIVGLDAGGFLTEVRVVDVAHGSSRELLRAGIGEGGQYFAGIGFARGYLEWVYSFGGSGGGELIPGIFRARLTSGELTRADFPQAVDGNVVGFAPFAADRAYMTDARAEEDGCGDDIDPATGTRRQCRLVQSGRLVFGRRLRGRF
jgi:hypothetical protein